MNGYSKEFDWRYALNNITALAYLISFSFSVVKLMKLTLDCYVPTGKSFVGPVAVGPSPDEELIILDFVLFFFLLAINYLLDHLTRGPVPRLMSWWWEAIFRLGTLACIVGPLHVLGLATWIVWGVPTLGLALLFMVKVSHDSAAKSEASRRGKPPQDGL